MDRTLRQTCARRCDLRSLAPLSRGTVAPGGPTQIERIDPDDGARGVFRDALVLVRFSWRIDPQSLTEESFRIEAPDGPVPGRVDLSPDGAVLLWQGHRLLEPGCVHLVVAAGLRDLRGRVVDRRTSRFVTSDLTFDDLAL